MKALEKAGKMQHAHIENVFGKISIVLFHFIIQKFCFFATHNQTVCKCINEITTTLKCCAATIIQMYEETTTQRYIYGSL